MKALNLDRLNSLACIASTVSSIGTGEARKVAGKLLELIETESSQAESLKSEDITDVANVANGCASQKEPGVTVGESYLKGLEQDRVDLRRLVALIGLHDGSVAINAQAATSALTAEIGELIAKHKA